MDDLLPEPIPHVGMEPDRPIRVIRRKRLEALLNEFGGAKALGDATKTTDTHLIACVRGRRDIGDKLATQLEERAGKPFGWMDGAISPEAQRLSLIFDRLIDPARREAVLARALSVIAGEFPETIAPVAAPSLPTSRRLQRS